MERLSSKEKSLIILSLSSYYDINTSFLEDYSFFVTKGNKVHICSANVKSFEKMRISSCGMYFGSIHDNNRFRLSIEGSRLIKPKKNYVILKSKSLSSYLSGENLFDSEVEEINYDNTAPFLIVLFENEHLGCVSLRGKELLTYVSKSRKLDFNKVF